MSILSKSKDINTFKELIEILKNQNISLYKRKVVEYFSIYIDSKLENTMDKPKLIKEYKDFSKTIEPSSIYFTYLKLNSLYKSVYILESFSKKNNRKILTDSIKLAERKNAKYILSKFLALLSEYYQISSPKYSETLIKKSREIAFECGDLYTMAFNGITMILSLFYNVSINELKRVLKELENLLSELNNHEINCRYFIFKSMIAAYDNRMGDSLKLIDNAKEEYQKTNKNFQYQFIRNIESPELLLYVTNGFDKELKMFSKKIMKESNYRRRRDDKDKDMLYKLANKFIENETDAYKEYKNSREKMEYFVEELAIFVSYHIDEECYSDFSDWCKTMISNSRKDGVFFSEAMFFEALARASKKAGKIDYAYRYARNAISYYSANGLFNRSSILEKIFFGEKQTVQEINKVKEVVLENKIPDLSVLENIEEAFQEQNLVLMNYGNLMSLFSEAENIDDILEMLMQYIKNNYPANNVRISFKWNEDIIKESGEEKIPFYDNNLNLNPFYIRYSIDLDENSILMVEIYNPFLNVEQAEMHKILKELSIFESLIILIFKNYMRYSMATIDSLTKLYTRWYFDSRIEEELKRAKRYNEEFSLIFCDLDNFKKINDRHGHLKGDLLLETVANILKNNCRDTDIVGRYGGEEFIILLPHTTNKTAIAIAQRLRYLIEVGTSAQIPITVSFGLTTFTSNSKENARDLIQIADDLCYKAKEKGKNRVEY